MKQAKATEVGEAYDQRIVKEAIATHLRRAEMAQLVLKLRLWAKAGELWQLSRTTLEPQEWHKYIGRCQLIAARWVVYRDKRRS